MGHGDKMIVPGDLEGSCNIISYIWSFEGKAYWDISDNWDWIIVTVKVKLVFRLIGPKETGDEIIVPGDMNSSCNIYNSIWSVEVKTYRSICDNWSWITVTVKVKLILKL